MHAFFDPRQQPIRVHPYPPNVGGTAKGYLDLKASPELIETALEDFLPYANENAIHDFYELLRVVNAVGGRLETNDSALRTPKLVDDGQGAQISGIASRITVLFRDLARNCNRPNCDWLAQSVIQRLQYFDPGMSQKQGSVMVTIDPVLYLALSNGRWVGDQQFEPGPNDPGAGYYVGLNIFAFGVTEAEAFENLGRVFRNIRAGLDSINGQRQSARD
jgi:hypothetical protein